jgi:hypothetical protein
MAVVLKRTSAKHFREKFNYDFLARAFSSEHQFLGHRYGVIHRKAS